MEQKPVISIIMATYCRSRIISKAIISNAFKFMFISKIDEIVYSKVLECIQKNKIVQYVFNEKEIHRIFNSLKKMFIKLW